MIVDSSMSFREAVAGTAAPLEVIEQMRLLDVQYYSFDGDLHQGQLVVHHGLTGEVREIFTRIRELRFPLARAMPVVYYAWSDEASMADNNTSAFNYRCVAGTGRLSRHAHGLAIDINPRRNPVIYADGTVLPPGAVYDPRQAGTLGRERFPLQEFLARGWHWGGDFKDVKDYHHVEKPL